MMMMTGVRCQSQRPHVVFVLADDLGWNDVSFHGSDQIPTPRLDSLAYAGVILHGYYATPICSPSRSAILTGKHPVHTGMHQDVIMGPQPYGLPLSERILPQYVKDLGYATHIVGKWHQGFFTSEYTPLRRGFDSHVGYWCGHIDYYDHTSVERPDQWGLDFRYNETIARDTLGRYATDIFTEAAVDIIRKHNPNQPLFLYLPHLASHAGNGYEPIQAPEEYVNRFPDIEDINRRKFAGVVTVLDESVGAVVDALAQYGMLNNSIIIFSGDNGGATDGFNGNAASNWPLRGCKDTLWEGGIRVPAFVWSPLIQKPSRVMNNLMSVEDWLPTIYSAIGGNTGDLPSDLDGMNMWPTISDDQQSPRSRILHNIDNDRGVAALRDGDFKIVVGTTYGGRWDGWYGPPAVRNDGHLLRQPVTVSCSRPTNFTPCEPIAHPSPCLFNIQEDPCEYNNLADSEPVVLKRLMDLLDEYNSTVVPARNQPDDPNARPALHGYAWVPWMDSVTQSLE